MTRFARARGSKASNERLPEESTPWSLMRKQLEETQQEGKDATERAKFEALRKENYEKFLKEQSQMKIEKTWCDFEVGTSKSEKLDTVSKKNAKKPKSEKKSKNKTKDQNIDTKPRKNYVSLINRDDDSAEENDPNVDNENDVDVENLQNNSISDEVDDDESDDVLIASDNSIENSENENDSFDDKEISQWLGEYSDEEMNNKFQGLTSQLDSILQKRTPKNKKKKSVSEADKHEKVESKNKKRKSNLELNEDSVLTNNELKVNNPSTSNKKSKKDKNKLKIELKLDTDVNNVDESNTKNKKKKKRKSNEESNLSNDKSEDIPQSVTKPKKQKILEIPVKESSNPNETQIKKSKKKKNKKEQDSNQNSTDNASTSKSNGVANVNISVPNNKENKNKKEKEHKRRKPLDTNKSIIIVNGEELEVSTYDGFPILCKDADRLQELRKNLITKGIPKSEVNRTMKLERRKAEKALSRMKKKLCFHCRKGGHNLSECPELNKKTENIGMPSTGICFKCGSTEHTHFACKVVRTQDYKFAQCFICKEQGHISRQCPDNPRGLYPKGGGCRECGDVTHLKKDCPKIVRQKEENTIKLDLMDSNNVEGDNKMISVASSKTNSVKHIKF